MTVQTIAQVTYDELLQLNSDLAAYPDHQILECNRQHHDENHISERPHPVVRIEQKSDREFENLGNIARVRYQRRLIEQSVEERNQQSQRKTRRRPLPGR